VHKSLNISNSSETLRNTQEYGIKYHEYCLKTFEAWEESGYLFIRSELCEKGNLNDFLVELEKQ
jgi:hypothetical protein